MTGKAYTSHSTFQDQTNERKNNALSRQLVSWAEVPPVETLAAAKFELLSSTVAWAQQHCEFYRKSLGAKPVVLRCIEDLNEIPIINKEIVANSLDQFTDLSEVPTAIHITTGTSAAPDSPFFARLSNEFSTALDSRLAAFATGGADEHVALHLHLSNGVHGVVDRPRGGKGFFVLPLVTRQHLSAAIALLQRTFSFSGSSTRILELSGGLNQVKMLTASLSERGISSDTFAVKRVAVFAHQLTPTWRDILAKYWKSAVLEMYSLSEVPQFVCTRWSSTDLFLFSGPVIPEVVSLNGCARLETGIGRIVVTPLLPFSAAQPILRYDTGDIADLKYTDPSDGSIAFELLGRRSRCVFWDFGNGEEILIAATRLNSLLASLPDVAVVQYSEAVNIGLHGCFGSPRCAISIGVQHNRVVVQLTLGLRFSPHEFPARSSEVAETVRTALLFHHPTTTERVERGEVVLDIECLAAESVPAFATK